MLTIITFFILGLLGLITAMIGAWLLWRVFVTVARAVIYILGMNVTAPPRRAGVRRRRRVKTFTIRKG